MINKPASEKMRIIHDTKRPMITDYINELFTDFTELHGDRFFSDDHAILGGVGYFNGTPVTVIGHRKGRTIEQNMDANFGMAHPEGYRRTPCIRLFRRAAARLFSGRTPSARRRQRTRCISPRRTCTASV